MSEKPLTPIEIGLTAAIVAIEGNEPLILTASGSDGDRLPGLPFGPFDAVSHRTFEIGLRAWVEEQAGLRLGYVEQLYTFGDRGRHTQAGDTHVASIGYLALTRAADNASISVHHGHMAHARSGEIGAELAWLDDQHLDTEGL